MSTAGRAGSAGRAERKHCRTCGAEVYWLRHVHTGKMAPIDAVPDAAGNVVIHLDRGTYENVPAGDREAHRDGDRRLHTNHFQTCPQSDGWKRRGSVRETEVHR